MMSIWSVNMYFLKWFGPVLLCRVSLHSFTFQTFTLVSSPILFYVLLSHWADPDSSIIFHGWLPPVIYYITALYNSGCSSANSNQSWCCQTSNNNSYFAFYDYNIRWLVLLCLYIPQQKVFVDNLKHI